MVRCGSGSGGLEVGMEGRGHYYDGKSRRLREVSLFWLGAFPWGRWWLISGNENFCLGCAKLEVWRWRTSLRDRRLLGIMNLELWRGV